MSKGKPRHNPDKPANKYGDRCPYWEEYINGTAGCEGSPLTTEQLKCNGNRHNCVKVKYHTAAMRQPIRPNPVYQPDIKNINGEPYKWEEQ